MKTDEEKFPKGKGLAVTVACCLSKRQLPIQTLGNSVPAAGYLTVEPTRHMTTRLKIPSAEDSAEIDVVITYEGKNTGEGAPAIVISHPYGPLG
jgi:hypothetical protein